MIALQLKLQGLWLGAALGELYARHRLRPSSSSESTQTAQTALPTVYQLCLFTARELQTASQRHSEWLHQTRSPALLLQVLVLAFLHPLGTQGLMADLTQARSQTDEPAWIIGAIAIVQTLTWLQSRPPSAELWSYLQQFPNLENTAIASFAAALSQGRHDLSAQSLSELQADPDRQAMQAIVQGLDCLVTTPEDFQLTVQRSARRLAHQPDLVILIAALTGFHNGLGTLPLEWRFRLKSIGWSVAMPLEEGLCTFANACAARWAGCYGTQLAQGARMTLAPPGQLRPRE